MEPLAHLTPRTPYLAVPSSFSSENEDGQVWECQTSEPEMLEPDRLRVPGTADHSPRGSQRKTAMRSSRISMLAEWQENAWQDSTRTQGLVTLGDGMEQGIWERKGTLPQSCFVPFASWPEQLRLSFLHKLVMVDIVLVTVVLVFHQTDGAPFSLAPTLVDVLGNVLYAGLSLVLQLRTSMVDPIKRTETVDPIGIALVMSTSLSSWADFVSSLFFWTLYLPWPRRCFALVRLTRGHRLFSTNQHSQQMSSGRLDNPLLQIFELFLYAYFFTHVATCLFYIVNPAEVELAWESVGQDYHNKPWHEIYVVAVRNGAYYLLGPKFMPEFTGIGKYVMETVCAPMSAVFGAWIFGRIVVLLNRWGHRWSQYLDRVDETTSAMRFLGCPQDLCLRAAQYHAYLMAYGMDHSIAILTTRLSPGLRKDIMMCIFKPLVDDAPFFRGMLRSCIERVVLAFEQLVFSPRDTILRKGDVGDDMFFVLRGICDVHVQDPEHEAEPVSTKGIGDFFGEVSLVFPEMTRTAWIMARCFCVLARLTRDALHSVLLSYPEQEKLMLQNISPHVSHVTSSLSLSGSPAKDKPRREPSSGSAGRQDSKDRRLQSLPANAIIRSTGLSNSEHRTSVSNEEIGEDVATLADKVARLEVAVKQMMNTLSEFNKRMFQHQIPAQLGSPKGKKAHPKISDDVILEREEAPDVDHQSASQQVLLLHN